MIQWFVDGRFNPLAKGNGRGQRCARESWADGVLSPLIRSITNRNLGVSPHLLPGAIRGA